MSKTLKNIEDLEAMFAYCSQLDPEEVEESDISPKVFEATRDILFNRLGVSKEATLEPKGRGPIIFGCFDGGVDILWRDEDPTVAVHIDRTAEKFRLWSPEILPVTTDRDEIVKEIKKLLSSN